MHGKRIATRIALTNKSSPSTSGTLVAGRFHKLRERGDQMFRDAAAATTTTSARERRSAF